MNRSRGRGVPRTISGKSTDGYSDFEPSHQSFDERPAAPLYAFVESVAKQNKRYTHTEHDEENFGMILCFLFFIYL